MPNEVISTRNIIKSVEPEDLKLLKIFVNEIKHHDTLTKNELVQYSLMHEDVVSFRIGRLQGMKLIGKRRNGFTLLNQGLDVMALRTMADMGIVSHIGGVIGIGKESDVMEAKTENDSELAIKFFRIGRTSFRDVRRKRGNSESLDTHKWHTMNIFYAKREYSFLERLQFLINVPKPVFRSFHCVVMRRIDAKRLIDIIELEDAQEVLDLILNNIKITYTNGIINCDISEYNILVDQSNIPWIIDWPQSIDTKHPNAKDLLKRDITNIVTFFNKRYSTGRNLPYEIEKLIG